jgi:hypothetical protein
MGVFVFLVDEGRPLDNVMQSVLFTVLTVNLAPPARRKGSSGPAWQRRFAAVASGSGARTFQCRVRLAAVVSGQYGGNRNVTGGWAGRLLGLAISVPSSAAGRGPSLSAPALSCLGFDPVGGQGPSPRSDLDRSLDGQLADRISVGRVGLSPSTGAMTSHAGPLLADGPYWSDDNPVRPRYVGPRPRAADR